jgi:hypothetical protein
MVNLKYIIFIISIILFPRCIVWTSDQQIFFFNPTSRTSLWDRPEELKGKRKSNKIMFYLIYLGRMDVDEMIRAATPQQDNIRSIPIKQKLDSIPDDTEPETKKIK